MWITERTHREKQKSSWLNTGCPLISCVIMIAPPVLIGLMHMSVQARILWRWEGEKHWGRGWSQVSALSLDLVFIQIMGAGVIQIQTLRSGGGRAGFKNFLLPFAPVHPLFAHELPQRCYNRKLRSSTPKLNQLESPASA